jgi:hypothetical protein
MSATAPATSPSSRAAARRDSRVPIEDLYLGLPLRNVRCVGSTARRSFPPFCGEMPIDSCSHPSPISRPGERILQAACVYGHYSPCWPNGSVEAARLCGDRRRRRAVGKPSSKVANWPQVRLHRGDLSRGHTGVPDGSMDAVACFFLLCMKSLPITDAALSNHC